MLNKFQYRHLLFMPSFFLCITLLPAYLLYCSDLIPFDKAGILVHEVILSTIIVGLLSTFVFSKSYEAIINSPEYRLRQGQLQPYTLKSKIVIVLLLLIGIAGIVKYTKDYSDYLGGAGYYFILLVEDSGKVRSMAENVMSGGIQLSYLTWIASFLVAANIGAGNISKKGWIIVLIVLVANLAFVDRTRPVWIMFTCIIVYFANAYHHIKRAAIIRSITSIVTVFLVVFILIGLWLGKITKQEDYTDKIPPVLQPVVFYTAGSFAYLNHILEMDRPVDYKPVRTTYPLQKVLAKLKLADEPPGQILDFYSVPDEINVSTFLEPYFSDGGLLFTAFGILNHTILFNFIALFFLLYPTRLSQIGVATLCYCNFMGFFTPAFTNFPTWLFLLLALGSAWQARAKERYLSAGFVK